MKARQGTSVGGEFYCVLFSYLSLFSVFYHVHALYVLFLLSIFTYISYFLAVFRRELSCTLRIPSLLFILETVPLLGRILMFSFLLFLSSVFYHVHVPYILLSVLTYISYFLAVFVVSFPTLCSFLLFYLSPK